ncbi:hypothetical protein [Mycobacterium sp. NAZ190054]|uniref:hypothetical protein n=1 Tax=Mycobacterium sp. NAZ190054 TaxID=1747766 RepID=UPI00079BBAF5|nr:hypothetical protein [Mycobacterium sp. NAZ190054]KWX65719.1 hypothetical protein ASJ79_07555 [Mycobacterium sp. NAZ190054]
MPEVSSLTCRKSGPVGEAQFQFASQQASCSVLDLTLIELNEVRLVITAIPADGLLGQLLCALALNQILGRR